MHKFIRFVALLTTAGTLSTPVSSWAADPNLPLYVSQQGVVLANRAPYMSEYFAAPSRNQWIIMLPTLASTATTLATLPYVSGANEADKGWNSGINILCGWSPGGLNLLVGSMQQAAAAKMKNRRFTNIDVALSAGRAIVFSGLSAACYAGMSRINHTADDKAAAALGELAAAKDKHPGRTLKYWANAGWFNYSLGRTQQWGEALASQREYLREITENWRKCEVYWGRLICAARYAGSWKWQSWRVDDAKEQFDGNFKSLRSSMITHMNDTGLGHWRPELPRDDRNVSIYFAPPND